MLTPFGPNIWIADGPTVTAAAGFHYPTRMVVMRPCTGGLVAWSPVALSDELASDMAALGPVRFLVPPNALHHSFLGDWQRAYPEAIVLAPPGLADKRPDIRFDAAFRDGPVAAWAGEIDVVLLRGNRITEEVVLFHAESQTAIFADLLQHLPPDWFTGWRALVARLDLMTGAEPQVPRKFRLAFTDRAAAREPIRRILAWPTERIIIAHGPNVTSDGAAVLRRAWRWLGV